MSTCSLVFAKLVALASSHLSEGRDVVVGSLVGTITENNLCDGENNALVLAVAVWKKASEKGA